MFDEMCGRDWRARKVALERLTMFVEKADARSLSTRRLTSIMDQYNQRILDQNMKVSVTALESLDRVIPMFRGRLSNVSLASMLVRNLTQQLGSTKSKIKDMALGALDTLIENTSASSVCIELANAAKHSLNNHTQVIVLERLCDILPAVYVDIRESQNTHTHIQKKNNTPEHTALKHSYKAKPRLVNTCIAPVALKFLGEMRGPMEAVNTRLLCEIYRLIGKRLLESAEEACESAHRRKLMKILEISGGGSGKRNARSSTGTTRLRRGRGY